MTGIAGWMGDGPPEFVEVAAELLTRFDNGEANSITGARAALVVADTVSHQSTIQSEDWIAAVWGRARFDDPTLTEIANREGTAAAMLRAYRERGAACLSLLHGTVAVAITNSRAGEVLVATDRAGIQPIYWAPLRGGVLFASRLDVLAAHPQIRPQLDHQSIYNYVHFHMVPGPRTIYTGTQRLLPGEMIEFRNEKVAVKRYWQLRFSENESRPFTELREEFIETLRNSVRHAMHTESLGCFLSGGTDSSTVSGMVGDVTGKPTATFSIGFDEPGYDEMEFARITAKHFRTDHHEYYVTPRDIVDAIPKLAQIHEQPFGNSSAVPTYFCARMARDHGVTTLLAGDGGDELFGGNERYATQKLFSLYEIVPSALRSRLIEPIAQQIPSAIPPLRWFKRYVEIASTPMPDRLDEYNLLERLGPASLFTPDFLAGIDRLEPRRIMTAAYFASDADSLINRMLTLDFKVTLADNDLPKVTRSCELAGVHVAFPLLDDMVIDFAGRLTPAQKLKRTKLRYFFKEALRGFLPDEVIRKKKHGFGLPFGAWLRRNDSLRSLVFDSLDRLKGRHIIEPRFINDLMSRHVQESASYFGTMAWVLMFFEHWFHHRYDARAQWRTGLPKHARADT